MAVGQGVTAEFKYPAVDQLPHLLIGQLGFSCQFAGIVVGFFLYRPVVVVSVHNEIKSGLGVVLLQHRQGIEGIVLVAVIKGNGDLLAATETTVGQCRQGDEFPSVACKPSDLPLEHDRIDPQASVFFRRSVRTDHVIHQHPWQVIG